MKNKSVVLSLLLALPLSLLSAAETSVLLIGTARQPGGDDRTMTVTGGARAVIKGVGDETRVSADEIAFDPAKNVLVCGGETAVVAGDRVFKAKGLTIELGANAVRVFVVNPGGILQLGERRGFEQALPGAQFTPMFTEKLPGVELELKRSTRR